MDAIAWALIIVGGSVAYAGATGQRIWAEVQAALTGGPRPSRRDALLNDAGAGTAGAGSGAPSTSDPSGPGVLTGVADAAVAAVNGAVDRKSTPTQLVQLVHLDGTPYGSHRLVPGAAIAYQRAQAQAGVNIPITSGYRDIVSETARNREDPQRFPVPNFHTAGAAIDVYDGAYNGLGWSGGNPATDPRVLAALASNGWVQWSRSKDRPHWSWGGRG